MLTRWLGKILVLVLLIPLPGIATPGADPEPASSPHEGLLAVLWVQRAAEYQALSIQAYRQARESLEHALLDVAWSAVPEQSNKPARALAPAVIVDVDETVLDNSYYQARLIRDGTQYGPRSWDPWVEEACATPVPGALEFCQHAASRGVTIFYVTNRRAHLQEATRRNLARCGFPLSEDEETVLVRTTDHDKSIRRADVARRFRVLLLIGDNGGDFSSRFESNDPAVREAAVAETRSWWGERWILLPNPMYGGWETALVQGDYSRPPQELLDLKMAALRVQPQIQSHPKPRPRSAF